MPIEISNRAELEAIGLDRSGDYLIVADIDMSGDPWVSPFFDFDTRFEGSIDGGLHVLSGLNGDGLIRYSRNGDGTLENIVITDANVVDKGVLADYHGYGQSGEIRNCHATGHVTSIGQGTGGLVGNPYGPVRRCGFVGTVTTNEARRVGLFCGYGRALLEDCHADGTLTYSPTTANSTIGAFVGDATNVANTTTNCYGAIAVVGASSAHGFARDFGQTVTSCYWDTDIGPAASGVGTPKTTANMKKQATFTDWNFTTIWSIDEDVDYPRLQVFQASAVPQIMQAMNQYNGGQI